MAVVQKIVENVLFQTVWEIRKLTATEKHLLKIQSLETILFSSVVEQFVASIYTFLGRGLSATILYYTMYEILTSSNYNNSCL